MIINHNIAALNTYSRLNSNNQAVSKALEKLSSGLRINRAADDAAGLAISEKMRSQINGLQQANRNVQDGISLIQTAEGALSEDHAILQRIRELTIQAANDTYTSNDRIEIQREIDLLRDEMDRIASTTQFNAKNLLDGTSAALVATDKTTTRVFMRGGLRETDEAGRRVLGGGNYKLDITATPGENQIQKTDIFKINTSGDQVLNLDLGQTQLSGLDAENLQKGTYYIETTANQTPGAANAAINAGATQNYISSGAALNNVFGNGALTLTTANNTYNISLQAEVKSINGNQVTYEISYHAYDRDPSAANSYLNGTFTTTIADVTSAYSIDITDGTNDTGQTIQVAAGSMAGLSIGDKTVLNISAATAAGNLYDTVDVTGKLYGTSTAGEQNLVSGWVFDNDKLNNSNLEINFFSLYQTVPTGEQDTNYNSELAGTTYDGTIKLDIDGWATSGAGDSRASFNFVDGLGQVADVNTKLKDIDKFWDANGNFTLENPKTISIIQGNGEKVSVVLTSADTIGSLKEKLNTAIKNAPPDGLGQSEIVGGAPLDENFVSYVTPPPDASGFETVPGTFLIRSAMPGKDGEMVFVGDDQVINALGLMTVQEAQSNSFTVNVTDAHDGSVIAQNVVIADNNLVGVIHDNVDVQFDAATGLVVQWDDTSKNYVFTGGAANAEQTFVHIADNSMIFQVGANQQQDVMAAIGDMSVRALGLDNYQVSSNYLANQALARVDAAISKVSAERSKLGAIQNRLDHTSNNLSVTAENLTAAESRIRDVDMAQEMLNFTKYNILSQASTAMLAQANQLPQSVLQLLK